MTESRRLAADTICVHGGAEQQPAEMGLNTPIVTSTAFDYTDGTVRYPRYLNTANHRVVASRIAQLEGGETAFATASGMGAISAVFLALMRPGDHAVLLQGLYGGTQDLVGGLLQPLGFEFSIWDGDPDGLAALVRPETKLAWCESPTNPLLRVVDLPATAKRLRELGVVSVIDNTFATPILQRPLDHGFDLVMHSATKYFGGHSDLLAGALAGRRELIERILPHAVRLGSSLNGQDLYQLERSLKTLALRVRRQSDSGASIAHHLESHGRVEAVYYPGLASDDGHAVARRQMDGYGGMLTFRLAEAVDPGEFLAALQLIRPAVSLAGVESTICQPSRTSHAKIGDAERQRLGIDHRLMRLSTGVEAVDDLIADLDAALG
jgi:cystathionine beta-lyase